MARTEVDFVAVLLGAVLLWTSDPGDAGRDDGVLRGRVVEELPRLFRDPASHLRYLTGLILAAVGSSAVSLVVMVTFARSPRPLVSVLWPFARALPYGSVPDRHRARRGGGGPRLTPGAGVEWLIWPIPTLVSPFAGVFYPVTVLPGWMQAIAALLPPSYVFEGMRAVVAGEPPPWDRLALGGGLAMVHLVLACLFFTSVYHTAIRHGLIARYSAETLS